MGRMDIPLDLVKVEHKTEVDAEVEEMSSRPDDVPADVWALIQENGRVATERLNDLLVSPKFARLRVGDQARLIALAQNRAYGTPKSNRGEAVKRRGSVDVTQSELANLVSRATLPEYKRARVEDAEVVETKLPN